MELKYYIIYLASILVAVSCQHFSVFPSEEYSDVGDADIQPNLINLLSQDYYPVDSQDDHLTDYHNDHLINIQDDHLINIQDDHQTEIHSDHQIDFHNDHPVILETSNHHNPQHFETQPIVHNPISKLVNKKIAKKSDVLHYLEAFIRFKRSLLHRFQVFVNNHYHDIKGFLSNIINVLSSVHVVSLKAVTIVRTLFEFIVQLFSGIDGLIGLTRNQFHHSFGGYFK